MEEEQKYYMLSPYEIFVDEYWGSRRNKEITPNETVNVYQLELDEMRSNYIMTAGLAGETGEVIELLKKKVRDGKYKPMDLAHELGDVLYYLTRIALEHGFTLDQIQDMNVEKLKLRKEVGKELSTEMLEEKYADLHKR